MQVSAFMTFNTVHARFAEVYIPGNSFIFSEELISHAASMTGSAGTGHGRGLFKHMPGEQPAADVLWLADMTFTAGGVAGGAVVAKHFFKSRVIFRYITGA